MVFQDVMDAFLFILLLHHGKHAEGSHKVGARFLHDVLAIVFRDILAHAHIVLATYRIVHYRGHADALVVVAVGVLQRVVALGDGLHLVEAGVGESLVIRGVVVLPGLGGIDSVRLGSDVVHGTGEDGRSVGLLRGHAAKRVVDDLAMCASKVYVGQAVHLVVVEGLLYTAKCISSQCQIQTVSL